MREQPFFDTVLVDGVDAARVVAAARDRGLWLRAVDERTIGLSFDETSDASFCTTYHATDAAYASKLHYWTTPQKQCVDGSGSSCTDYSEWTSKWQAIKG